MTLGLRYRLSVVGDLRLHLRAQLFDKLRIGGMGCGPSVVVPLSRGFFIGDVDVGPLDQRQAGSFLQRTVSFRSPSCISLETRARRQISIPAFQQKRVVHPIF